MKPLKKPTKAKNCPHKKRFDAVCKVIREELHLDHLEQHYEIGTQRRGSSIATTTVQDSGWRLYISVLPPFWEDAEFEQQARWLIHEHTHVVLHAYHQADEKVVEEWTAPHCRTQVRELLVQGAEISVDHLTEVFYRLLKDRLADL